MEQRLSQIKDLLKYRELQQNEIAKNNENDENSLKLIEYYINLYEGLNKVNSVQLDKKQKKIEDLNQSLNSIIEKISISKSTMDSLKLNSKELFLNSKSLLQEKVGASKEEIEKFLKNYIIEKINIIPSELLISWGSNFNEAEFSEKLMNMLKNRYLSKEVKIYINNCNKL